MSYDPVEFNEERDNILAMQAKLQTRIEAFQTASKRLPDELLYKDLDDVFKRSSMAKVLPNVYIIKSHP